MFLSSWAIFKRHSSPKKQISFKGVSTIFTSLRNLYKTDFSIIGKVEQIIIKYSEKKKRLLIKY
jgi:hypothetical protein